MPRIIRDLDTKILKVAEELFKENDYEKVDMRQLAKKIGIAVGTLYNYYSNKENLYIEVYKYSWNKTFNILEEIIKYKLCPKEKIKKFLITVYEGKRQRKYLCKKRIAEGIFSNNASMKENKRFIWEELISKMISIFNDFRQNNCYPFNENYDEFLATSLLMSVFSLHDEREDNDILNFIEVYIEKLFN